MSVVRCNNFVISLLSLCPYIHWCLSLASLQSQSFVKCLSQVTLGWHQVALQCNQHNGPHSPTVQPLPCEIEKRVHYRNMPAALQLSLQHRWVLTHPRSASLPDWLMALLFLFSCPSFPGEQGRRGGWMNDFTVRCWGKQTDFLFTPASVNTTDMHCENANLNSSLPFVIVTEISWLILSENVFYCIIG